MQIVQRHVVLFLARDALLEQLGNALLLEQRELLFIDVARARGDEVGVVQFHEQVALVDPRSFHEADADDATVRLRLQFHAFVRPQCAGGRNRFRERDGRDGFHRDRGGRGSRPPALMG